MLLYFVFLLSLTPQQRTPLPDAQTFRSAVPTIVNITGAAFFHAMYHRDFIPEAKDYSYTETETALSEDPRVARETKVYNITRGPESWQSYRRQVSVNGIALPDSDLERQDREQLRFDDRMRMTIASVRSRTASEEAAATRAQQYFEEDLRTMFDIRVLDRMQVENIPVILLELKPRSRYRPKTESASFWRNFTLRAWITENGDQVMRVIAEIDEEFDEGIALVEKGAVLSVERAMIHGEIWMPIRIEITKHRARTNGGLSSRRRVITELSDFKRFTTDTVIRPEGVVQ